MGMSPWRRQGGPENSWASTTLSLICLTSDHHQWVVQVLGSLALWSCLPPPPPLFPARAILPIIHPPNLAFTHCIRNITSVLCCVRPSVPCRPPGAGSSCVPIRCLSRVRSGAPLLRISHTFLTPLLLGVLLLCHRELRTHTNVLIDFPCVC